MTFFTKSVTACRPVWTPSLTDWMRPLEFFLTAFARGVAFFAGRLAEAFAATLEVTFAADFARADTLLAVVLAVRVDLVFFVGEGIEMRVLRINPESSDGS